MLCFLWIIVGPEVTVLRTRRKRYDSLGNLGQVAGHLLAGNAMNVVVVFMVFILLSGMIGIRD